MATYTGPVSFVANGTDTAFVITFPFLASAFLVVKLDDVLQVETTDYSLSGSTVTMIAAPVSGQTVEISRLSGASDALYLSSFSSDMKVSGDVLERIGTQPWHVLQELKITVDALSGAEDLTGVLSYSSSADGYDALSRKVRSLGDPLLAGDATNKRYVDSIATFGIGGVPVVVMGTTDGVLDTFDLIGVPEVVANNLIVFLGGSIQQPGADYTVIGGSPDSTISFVVRPADALSYTIFVIKAIQFIPAASIGDGEVLTAMLDDGGVTTVKLADLAVTSAKIATGGVSALNIADGAILNAKIPDGEIEAAKLAAGALVSSVGDSELMTTGFAVAPGGSVDPVMFIERTSGSRLNRPIVAADISNLQATLAAETLDQFTPPVSSMDMGTQFIQDVLDPVLDQDAATKKYVDDAVATDAVRGPFLIADTTVVGGSTHQLTLEGWYDAGYTRYEIRIIGMQTDTAAVVYWRAKDQATGVWLGEDNSDKYPGGPFGGDIGVVFSALDGLITNSYSVDGTLRQNNIANPTDRLYVSGDWVDNSVNANAIDGVYFKAGTSSANFRAGTRVQIYAWSNASI